MSQLETSNKEIMGLRKMLYAFTEEDVKYDNLTDF